MPSFSTSSSGVVYRLRVLPSPGSSLRSTPSRPEARIATAARYGFAEPSTERCSKRGPPGTRIICVRLLPPQAAYAGDHVAPEVGAPTPIRLYELTVGATIADADEAWSSTPPMKL